MEKPIQPEKIFIKDNLLFEIDSDDDKYFQQEGISKFDLKEIKKEYPEVDYNNLRLEFELDHGYDSCDTSINVKIFEHQVIENIDYENQLKDFELKLKEFKEYEEKRNLDEKIKCIDSGIKYQESLIENSLQEIKDIEKQTKVQKLKEQIKFSQARIEELKSKKEILEEDFFSKIPNNLEEAFLILDQMQDIDLNQSLKQIFLQSPTSEIVIELHNSLGRKLRNDWKIWQGKDESELVKFFYNNFRIEHPDDISGMILTSYWRYVHGQQLKLKEQAEFYLDYWRKLEKNENI